MLMPVRSPHETHVLAFQTKNWLGIKSQGGQCPDTFQGAEADADGTTSNVTLLVAGA